MKRFISVFSMLFIFLFLILLIMLPKKNFSDNENRYLEKMDKFNVKNVISGKFQKSVDNYFSDHFPFRDYLLGCKNRLFHLLGVYRINGVYYTNDNRLVEEFKKPNNTDRIIRIINKFSLKHNDKKIDFILSPTSLYTNKDNISMYNINYSEDKVINYYKKKLDVNFIDVREDLLKHRNEYIFYNSDHHWTTLGSYYAYRRYCNSKKITFNKFDFKKIDDNFRGTLYSKILDNSTKKDYIIRENSNGEYKVIADGIVIDQLYESDFLNKKDKYSYFLGGNKGLITIENIDIKSNSNILVIKDSYANSFIPFISSNYRNVYVIDPRYYNESIDELINKNNIDNILFLYNVLTIDDDIGILSINR